QDIVLGLYYMTRERPFVRGEGKTYCSPDEVWLSWQAGETDLQAKIRCRVDSELVTTTVGRVLLAHLCPPVLPFTHFDKVMKKKEISQLIDECFRVAG